MTEAILGLLLAASVLAGAAGVLRAEWDRFKCEWVAFEVGHRRLVEEVPGAVPRLIRQLGSRTDVQVTDTGPAIHAEAICGGARAQIDFPKLEYAKW